MNKTKAFSAALLARPLQPVLVTRATDTVTSR